MTIKPVTHNKGVLSLILVAVIWGTMPLYARWLNVSFLLFQQVYLRMIVGFFLSLLVFRKKLRWKKLKNLPARDWGVIIFRSLAYYLFGVVMYTQALLLTKIANVSFIGAIPMTALLGFVLFKEKVSLAKVGLVVTSFLGVLFIAIKDFSGLSDFAFGKGELLALASAVFISLAMLSRKWQTEALNDQETSSLILFFAALSILVTSLFVGESLPFNNWNLNVALVLLAAGVMNIAISFLISYGFARVEGVLASNLLASELVFSVLFGFLFFQELPVVREFIGGLVIIASAIGMNQVEAKEKAQ